MEQGITNRLIGIGKRLQRRRRINHAGADRQLLEQEIVAIRDQAALGAAIGRDDQILARADLMLQFGGFQFF